MTRRITATHWGTLVNCPGGWPGGVMMPKKTSTSFSQDPEVGVKCIVTRGCRANQAAMSACWWVW
jgi:hypothetical protein